MTVLPYLSGQKDPPPLLGLALSLLRPPALLYGGIQMARAALYRHGFLSSHLPPVPTIRIGNLTAGGTGKTPMTLLVAEGLSQRGYRVAVVSRGYGQRSTAPVTVVSDGQQLLTHPPQAADEAFMVAKRLPEVMVLTGAKRSKTIAHAVKHLGATAVVMDDGFQHLQIQAHCNLLLLDARLPLGNGRVQPAGILREFPHAMGRADLVVITRAHDPQAAAACETLIRRHHPHVPIRHATHAPLGWKHLKGGPLLPFSALADKPSLAFAGIADPVSFQDTLTGMTVRRFLPFADHHAFTAADMAQLQEEARKVGAQCLLCTEKDAVKISDIALDIPLYSLSIGIKMATSDLLDLLVEHCR